MSIGSLGMIGSFAATSAAQRMGDTERIEKETVDKSRQSDAELSAEKAAGIGQTEEEAEVADRDADGRRPWEFSAHARPQDESSNHSPPPHAAKDPTGDTGTTLDISG